MSQNGEGSEIAQDCEGCEMAYNLQQLIWIHLWKRQKVEDERSRFATYTIKRKRLLTQ